MAGHGNGGQQGPRETLDAARTSREQAIELRQMARTLRESVVHARTSPRAAVGSAAFRSLPVPAAVVDTAGRIAATNRAWGMTFENRLREGCEFTTQWVELGGSTFVADAVRQVLGGGAGVEVETDVHDGRTRHMVVQIAPTAPGRGAALLIAVDISAQHEREERLLYDATHDPLTGLANRVWLIRAVADALALHRRYGQRCGLIYLDLDGFKAVNDELGHAAGDAILRTVAERWAHLVRARDLLARVGGDEFVLLVPRLHGPDHLAALAQRLTDALNTPCRIGQVQVRIGVTAGIAEPPADSTADNAIALADAAMYARKRRRVTTNGRSRPGSRRA